MLPEHQLMLPDGIDSLVVTADQILSLGSTNAYSEAEIFVSLNQGVSWVRLYYQTSSFSTSEPLRITMTSIARPGLPFQIKFCGTASGTMYGGSVVNWILKEPLVTDYVHGLVLEQGPGGRSDNSGNSVPGIGRNGYTQ